MANIYLSVVLAVVVVGLVVVLVAEKDQSKRHRTIRYEKLFSWAAEMSY